MVYWLLHLERLEHDTSEGTFNILEPVYDQRSHNQFVNPTFESAQRQSS